jgi:hypothetical protein
MSVIEITHLEYLEECRWQSKSDSETYTRQTRGCDHWILRLQPAPYAAFQRISERVRHRQIEKPIGHSPLMTNVSRHLPTNAI